MGLVIGYFSRIEKAKGIFTLIDALAMIKDENFKLLLVGWSDNHFEDFVFKRAEENGIFDKIVFITERLGQKIVDYINCADFVVVPSITTSIWKEQFGRINSEVMACGVPVIGSSSGGIPEVVGDGGLIFRENDPDDLKNKIVMLLRDKKLLSKLGKLAYKRVQDNYSVEKSAEKTLNLYRFLINH